MYHIYIYPQEILVIRITLWESTARPSIPSGPSIIRVLNVRILGLDPRNSRVLPYLTTKVGPPDDS